MDYIGKGELNNDGKVWDMSGPGRVLPCTEMEKAWAGKQDRERLGVEEQQFRGEVQAESY